VLEIFTQGMLGLAGGAPAAEEEAVSVAFERLHHCA